MEQALADFISSVSTISGIRNFSPRNPIVFQMQQPTTQQAYVVVGSSVEPSYLGIPIYTTWVVLDPTSPYYNQALKLRPSDFVVGDTGLTIATGFTQIWTIVRDYDGIWEGAQYYQGAEGPAGTPGSKWYTGSGIPAASLGIANDMYLDTVTGDVYQNVAGTWTFEMTIKGADIDYNALAEAMKALRGTLAIIGPADVNAQSEHLYTVEYTPKGGTTPMQVNVPILNLTAVDGVAIMGDNVLRVGAVSDAQVTLSAMYVDYGFPVEAQITVQIDAATVTSLAISGPQTVYGGGTGSYSCVATYSDGSTKTVAPTWSIDTPSAGTINSSGVLAAAVVTANTPANIGAAFGGVTASYPITVVEVIPTALTVNGSSTVAAGGSTTYTANVTFNNGTNKNVTPVWSVAAQTGNTLPAGTSISASGVLTAGPSGSTVGATVSASYVDPATSIPVSGSKNVNITSVVYAKYGAGPAFVHNTDAAGFIKSLSGTGTNANTRANTFGLTVNGPDAYMWYAYPKAWGLATFTDASNNFQGGWDGAGLPFVNVPAGANVFTTTTGTNPVATGGANLVTVSATDPTAAGTANQVVVNTTSGVIWQYIGTTWTNIGQADTAAAPKSGDIWYNTRSSQVYSYNGTNWSGVGSVNPTNYPTGTVFNPATITVDGVDYYAYRSDQANLGDASDNNWIVS